MLSDQILLPVGNGVYFIFPKGPPEVGPRVNLCLWLTVRRYRIAHTPIRYVGYTLLSINIICLLFRSHPSALRFCQLWPLMCLVYCLCEKQGTPHLSSQLSSSSPSLCQQVSCYSVWTEQFSKQCKCWIQQWHFCGISAGSVGRTRWLAVKKLTSVISSTHEPQLSSERFKCCHPHSVTLLFWHEFK